MLTDMSPEVSTITQKTDVEIEAMSGGDFYHYMLTQDHYVWAKWANKMGKLGLSKDDEDCLASWFANAMCAVVDRPAASYIRARLDSEQAECVNAIDLDPIGKPMNFISREQVLEILQRHGAADIQREVEALFSFPEPNPGWRHNNRNVMGQTEDEFWDKVDREDR